VNPIEDLDVSNIYDAKGFMDKINLLQRSLEQEQNVELVYKKCMELLKVYSKRTTDEDLLLIEAYILLADASI